MKKITTITILLFLLFSLDSFSQSSDYKSTVSVGVGQSMVKAVADIFLSGLNFEETGLEYKSLPAFYGNYDYQITDWFSAGVAGSYQSFHLNETATSSSVDITRLNFGLRGLFHYVNNENLDMYSGVRFSTTLWNLNSTISSGDPEIDQLLNDLNQSRFFSNSIVFAPQIVAFGIKGYFTDNLGAHFEFSIGSPYYLSGGFNVRF